MRLEAEFDDTNAANARKVRSSHRQNVKTLLPKTQFVQKQQLFLQPFSMFAGQDRLLR